MGTTPGQTRADVGRRKRRRPTYANRPRDLFDLALNGSRSWGESLSANDWEALRVRTWERWHRDAEARPWPPHGAALDGIIGEALRVRFNPPEGYVGGWDATPRIVALAETGLAEVENFIAAKPKAARSIAEPLREYARRLREVSAHPESRLLARGPGS